ncbi:hypothetical protein [Cellulomonas terrae]|uniref:Uncharacterized protein n=1 Tax=Cellulomonas terrae TaxID=311234 RepID=A0A511JK55_9CELL|nr:hypothetical protein [Cellulomonas terrae]GEL98391.1 hypothetical protein CTE05_19380 [Cellulomonas terrae]
MTSSEPPQPAPARRSRRAVRHAGTVGGDDANLVSTHPALGTDTPRPEAGAGDTRATEASRDAPGRPGDPRPGTGQPAREPVVATRSADDSDVGWGDREGGSNDDRLHQDKPPHW